MHMTKSQKTDKENTQMTRCNSPLAGGETVVRNGGEASWLIVETNELGVWWAYHSHPKHASEQAGLRGAGQTRTVNHGCGRGHQGLGRHINRIAFRSGALQTLTR